MKHTIPINRSETPDDIKRDRDILLRAMERIADCNDTDMTRYCKNVDSIAVDVLVAIEVARP